MTDLLTGDEARQVVGRGITDSSKQELLAIAVSALSAKLVECVGPVVYGTVTAEAHDGGGNLIYLAQRPVAQIISVTEYAGTVAGTLAVESNASKPSGGYLLADPVSGALIRRDSNRDARFPAGRGNVLTTYVAGRCQGTAIPEKFKLGAALMLKSGWRAWEAAVASIGEFEVPQATFPSFAVPKAVKELLADEWQTGSGTGG